MKKRKVYYVRIPKKHVEVYRVVATSKEEAIELMAVSGEQLANENEMDTGPKVVTETDEDLNEYE